MRKIEIKKEIINLINILEKEDIIISKIVIILTVKEK